MCCRPVVVWALCSLAIGSPAALGEAPYAISWASQPGTAASDGGTGIATDGTCNCLLAVSTGGALDGNNAGGRDAALVKLDPNGQLLWARQIGTSRDEETAGVAVDSLGCAYLAGYTLGSLPNAGGSQGHQDVFLAKYDGTGTPLWTRQMGSSGADWTKGVAVDAHGAAYVVGLTEGNVEGTNAGSTDAFVIKYDAAGGLQWARQFGSQSTDRALRVAVDRTTQAVYVTGNTDGDLAGNIGGYDAFLSKFDANGNQLWTKQFGSVHSDLASSVGVDGNGNVYVAGETFGDAWGPQNGNGTAFVCKFTDNGTLLWGRQIESTRCRGRALGVDSAGNSYVSGFGYGVPGPDLGGYDLYLHKFDGDGNLVWAQQFGTCEHDYAADATVNAHGHVLVAGHTYGDFGGANKGSCDALVVDFVPEPATLSLLALGGLALARRRKLLAL